VAGVSTGGIAKTVCANEAEEEAAVSPAKEISLILAARWRVTIPELGRRK